MLVHEFGILWIVNGELLPHDGTARDFSFQRAKALVRANHTRSTPSRWHQYGCSLLSSFNFSGNPAGRSTFTVPILPGTDTSSASLSSET